MYLDYLTEVIIELVSGDSFSNLSSALIGALIGGLLTGIYARQVSREAATAENARRQSDARDARLSLLTAIRSEVVVLWRSYKANYAKHLANIKPNEPFWVTFPAPTDYFKVYSGNTGALGSLADVTLVEEIVAFYTQAKGLLVAIEFNRELLKKSALCQDKLDSHSQQQWKKSIEENAEYAQQLKNEAELLEQRHSILMKKLDAVFTKLTSGSDSI